MAQIHVLLTDDPAELPGGASDVTTFGWRIVTAAMFMEFRRRSPSTYAGSGGGSSYATMFAMGFTYIPDPTSVQRHLLHVATAGSMQDWPYGSSHAGRRGMTLQPTAQVPPAADKPGSRYNPAQPGRRRHRRLRRTARRLAPVVPTIRPRRTAAATRCLEPDRWLPACGIQGHKRQLAPGHR